MSTKTTFKRIALVAVAALGLSGLTGVAANAGQGLVGGAVSLASSSTSATVGVETTVTATFSGYCLGVAAAGPQDNRGAFAIYTNSVPANGSGVIAGLALTKATVTGAATDNQDNATAIAYDCTGAGFFSGTATAKVTLPSAGTYTFKIEGVYQVGGSATWTVTAAPKGAITAAASTLSATSVTGAKGSGVQAGQIVVAANNAAGNADAAVLSATISGVGLISWANFAAAGRNVSQAANNAGTLTVYGDGNSGTGTISIYSGSTLLGQVNATFYGTIVKLIATQTVYALDTAVNAATTFAVISAVDANNVAVPIVAADGTASAANGAFSDAAGVAAGTVSLQLNPNALAGSKSTVWTHTATGVTVDASVIVSSQVVSTMSVVGPSDSLVPGQMYTIQITEKDANANVIPDNAARALTITTSRAASVAPPATAKFVNGVATVTLYAPVTPGDFTVTVSDANGVGGVAVSNTQSVSLGNPSQDSIDAANEATDAANAATDAANAAAEAADAATAAAQDAQAAVAELATQVAALIAGIKAQITTLTNLVIKIQKKVKA